MDEPDLCFDRDVRSRPRTVLLLRQHLIDRLNLCQRRRHQRAEDGAQHCDGALGPRRRIDADDKRALLDLDVAEHRRTVFHRHVIGVVLIVGGIFQPLAGEASSNRLFSACLRI